MAERPKVAVLTMARDEGDLLRVWVDHYARQVGRDHVVVLDDNSTDGSTEGLDCTVHHLPEWEATDGFETVRMRLANRLSAGLLAVYDYVAFVDVDEFLVTDPAKYADLPELLAARPDPEVLGVVGLNVVHVAQVEGALDLGRPILEQRSFAKFTPLMCKPSVKRVDARWTVSSHGIQVPYAVDPELFMLHLKFADRDRLADVAGRRYQMTQVDGRGDGSSWAQTADHVLGILDQAVGDIDLDTVPEFDPYTADLAGLVETHNGRYRTPKVGQMRSLRIQPLIRIPARLAGTL